jgi:hypothetical protein
MSISTFKRYEMKFLLTKNQFTALIPKLQPYMNSDEHCQNGKDYRIYNIYYDTPDNYLIRTSLSKPYYKEKLRLRSYCVSSSLDDKVYLELKKKTAGIVSKRRAAMSLKQAYEFIQSGKRPVTDKYINEQVGNELEYFLSQNQVLPATYISYTRMAFFGKEDSNFRITFDCDITTRRYDLLLEKGCYGDSLLQEGQHLMEVKISSAVPIWLAELLADLQIYKTSFSKYGTEYQKFCCSRETHAAVVQNEEVSMVRPKLCTNF